MAKSSDSILHTRRGFSKWLAGTAALPVISTAVQARPAIPADFYKAAQNVALSVDVYTDADCNVLDSEAVLARWERRFPLPHDYESSDSDDPMKAISQYNKRRNDWYDRQTAVMRRLGFGTPKKIGWRSFGLAKLQHLSLLILNQQIWASWFLRRRGRRNST